MTRLVVLALALAFAFIGLACTSKPQDTPPTKGDAKGETKGDTKAPDPEPTPRMCTEMACSDSATIKTKLTAAGAPLGKHDFVLEVDGTAQACTAEFTVATQLAHATCSGNASVWIGPEMRSIVEELPAQGVVSVREEPIAGEFAWQASVMGTPAKVHVIHTHDGKVLLDQTAEFANYTEFRPNGEGCEPVCKAAGVEWKGL